MMRHEPNVHVAKFAKQRCEIEVGVLARSSTHGRSGMRHHAPGTMIEALLEQKHRGEPFDQRVDHLPGVRVVRVRILEPGHVSQHLVDSAERARMAAPGRERDRPGPLGEPHYLKPRLDRFRSFDGETAEANVTDSDLEIHRLELTLNSSVDFQARRRPTVEHG